MCVCVCVYLFYEMAFNQVNKQCNATQKKNKKEIFLKEEKDRCNKKSNQTKKTYRG